MKIKLLRFMQIVFYKFSSKFKNHKKFQAYFSSVFKHGIEAMLQGKIDQHLSHSKHSEDGCHSDKSCNLNFFKTPLHKCVRRNFRPLSNG